MSTPRAPSCHFTCLSRRVCPHTSTHDTDQTQSHFNWQLTEVSDKGWDLSDLNQSTQPWNILSAVSGHSKSVPTNHQSPTERRSSQNWIISLFGCTDISRNSAGWLSLARPRISIRQSLLHFDEFIKTAVWCCLVAFLRMQHTAFAC